MFVAERFKLAHFVSLPIQPSAAYLLAASSVPDTARQKAGEVAEAGEQVTTMVTRIIVAEAKKKGKGRRESKPLSAEKVGARLLAVLQPYKERWKADEFPELAGTFGCLPRRHSGHQTVGTNRARLRLNAELA